MLEAVNFLLSLGVIALLLAMIFKYLPDADVAWVMCGWVRPLLHYS